MINAILAILKSGNPNLQSLSERIFTELIKKIKELKDVDDLSKC